MKTTFPEPIRFEFPGPIRKIRVSSANENNVYRANRNCDNKAWLKPYRKNQSKLSFPNQSEKFLSSERKAGFPQRGSEPRIRATAVFVFNFDDFTLTE